MKTRPLHEGKHKPGCTCGFCKNKGRFGKKPEAAEPRLAETSIQAVYGGKKYPAAAEDNGGMGQYIRVYNYQQNQWDRASGSRNDIIAQGWLPELEQQGWQIIGLQNERAARIVSTLLEQDIPVQTHDFSKFDREQLAIGTREEMEHTGDVNTARQIAATHLSQDKDYYRKMQQAGLLDKMTPEQNAITSEFAASWLQQRNKPGSLPKQAH